MAAAVIKPPFPYFGGKSAIAADVWKRFGHVDNYIEPFCGSAAMLMADPYGVKRRTINDIDGMVINFYRAVSSDPDAVAKHVDNPISEIDLFARHIWLVNQKEEMLLKLQTDPEWFDAKAAGWWCWGLCCWIGSGWCSGSGAWGVVDGQIVKGVDLGVNRQIPDLATMGRGVNRPIDKPSSDNDADASAQFLKEYMHKIKGRLRRVRAACGDWKRVLTPTVAEYYGITAIFLDPPYGEGNVEYSSGGNTDKSIANEVWDWAVKNGDNPTFRIAVCGYADGREVPPNWKVENWKAPRGYQVAENDRSGDEVIWYSPHCLSSDNPKQLSIFD